MREMFFEGMQSYFATLSTLLIFIILLIRDQLFSKYTKYLFAIETIIISLIVCATWTDRVVSAMGPDLWSLRTLTTFINFCLSPLSPLILGLIYRKNIQFKTRLLYLLPAAMNCILCVVSISNGCVFRISHENFYNRGPLFFVPFAVSAFYLFFMIIFTVLNENNHSRKAESLFITLIMCATALASLLEIVFVIRFMIWSTTEVCVIIYYLVLTTQKIMYDPLTGTLSRIAYIKRLEKINGNSVCTLAMIDLNGLKTFNDMHGHDVGDVALQKAVHSINKYKLRKMKLYRYAGDEFVVIAPGKVKERMTRALNTAQQKCGVLENKEVTFSFGITEYTTELNLKDCISAADQAMYTQKRKMKAQ